MATLEDLYRLKAYRAEAIYMRLTAAVAQNASYVLIEDGATANHANRVAWAKLAVLDPDAMAHKMAWLVTLNPAGQKSDDAVTDNDLNSIIGAILGTPAYVAVLT